MKSEGEKGVNMQLWDKEVDFVDIISYHIISYNVDGKILYLVI